MKTIGLSALVAGMLLATPALSDEVRLGFRFGPDAGMTLQLSEGTRLVDWDPTGSDSGSRDRPTAVQRHREREWRRVHDWRDDHRRWSRRVQVCTPVIVERHVYDHWGRLKVVRRHDEECRWVRR